MTALDCFMCQFVFGCLSATRLYIVPLPYLLRVPIGNLSVHSFLCQCCFRCLSATRLYIVSLPYLLRVNIGNLSVHSFPCQCCFGCLSATRLYVVSFAYFASGACPHPVCAWFPLPSLLRMPVGSPSVHSFLCFLFRVLVGNPSVHSFLCHFLFACLSATHLYMASFARFASVAYRQPICA